MARIFRISTFGLLVAAALAGCRDERSNDPISRGPMVQMVSATELSVVWTAPAGAKQSFEATSAGSESNLPNKLEQDSTGRMVATVMTTEPGVDITYRILGGADKPLAERRTRFAPPANEDAVTPFRFLAFGDSGMGNEEQYQLAREMTAFEPRLIVHTGDLIYPDGVSSDYPAKFYQPYADLIATAPFYPCVGNHDFHTNEGGPLFEEFLLPRNGPQGHTPERHYWFDYGCVRFVAIDTDLFKKAIDEEIVPWLDKVLNAPEPRWKIVFFHHPVYSNAHYGPTRKLWDHLVPCMERHRVNLVLNGHDHLYERTHPIRERKVVAPGQGIVYITTGAGGAKLYPPRSQPMEEMAVASGTDHSFTVIDVSASSLKLKQIEAGGKLLDEYEIPPWKATNDLSSNTTTGSSEG